ncbi:amylo-alpha-1,6-glucosidase [Candidatus Methylacidithermus pantelleriae]|uniref:Amylo-alpha-1,6-glucosidase n=1 Tax=Candidatus Methylacidithermus pantelleriae TaxID=2744239 RepID=A0A8J2BJA3_9BACT|nr:amylo-alpha-1,6-glucosidase [Candidatus Methylacidithermus pantelleriae]CAF0691913.1 conserved hypothetical protein [Candidatus Methylacidithermus pantelleriae]
MEQASETPSPKEERAIRLASYSEPELGEMIDEFSIRASGGAAAERSRVLKCGDLFAVADSFGDMRPELVREQGLYYKGTRFLAQWQLELEGGRPLLLSSTVKEDNVLLAVDLTNPDMEQQDGRWVRHGTLHMFRSRFLWKHACFERLRVTNYGLAPVSFGIGYAFGADFVDLFEVRGLKRKRRGSLSPPKLEEGSVSVTYHGLDGVTRVVRLVFWPAPQRLEANRVVWQGRLVPKAEWTIFVTIFCMVDEARPLILFYEAALSEATETVAARKQAGCQIVTSNEQFNDWLNRSLSDIHLMITETPEGPYPHAGIPWFSTPFGRDGIITALELLWVNPNIARGVLAFLAATQAQAEDPARDAQPGKILHEMRDGEMAALGEIPFGRYYGSVDATPLFVLLAGRFLERTGDLAFLRSLWPNIQAALEWMDHYGDRDGDGFVEYLRESPKGLVHQGWKDSSDAIFHRDGRLAEGPIALCEVQGYVFAAKQAGGRIARRLGYEEISIRLEQSAERLRQQFEQAFWCGELSMYAMALDGKKRPCCVRSSNAGHALFAGIATPNRARRVAEVLCSEEMFSGWGIRTIGSAEARFNPMSYHNGSVWPHDNALIGKGLATYGFREETLKILTGLFDASLFMDLHRLPELFCGFRRRPGEGPTLYPSACVPQAWAAASVFYLLEACLGMTIHGEERRVVFDAPRLPPFLEKVQIRNLSVGESVIDLFLERRPAGDVGIDFVQRQGTAEVAVVKRGG